MKILLLICVVLAAIGCGRIGQSNRYLIVASSQSTESDPTSSNGKRYLVIYTIEHKGVTIKAHCQLYDPKNRCGELRAGETYDFKRDDSLRFLTLGQSSDNSSVVLGIDEERMH